MKVLQGVGKLSILILVFLLSGCELKDLLSTDDTQPPALPTVVFKGPQTNSTNQEAQNTKTAVEAMNGFSGYFLIFLDITPTSSDNTFTWTYSSQNFTIRLIATKQTDGGYAWKIMYNGTDAQGKTYNNWTSLEGTTSGDSKNGTWVLYEDNSTTKAADYQWATSATGVLTGTFKLYSNSNLTTQIVLASNPLNSGELKIYDGTALVYRSVWQPNGSGQWWRYDASGQITGSGLW